MYPFLATFHTSSKDAGSIPRNPPKCFMNARRSDCPAGTSGRGVRKSRCSRGVAKSGTWRGSSCGTGVAAGVTSPANAMLVRVPLRPWGRSKESLRSVDDNCPRGCSRITRHGGGGTGAMPLAVQEVPSTSVFEEPRGVNEARGALAGETPRAVEPVPGGNAVSSRPGLGRGPRVHPCRDDACTRQGIGRRTSWCAVAPGGPSRRGTCRRPPRACPTEVWR